jgi:hypothetical protein
MKINLRTVSTVMFSLLMIVTAFLAGAGKAHAGANQWTNNGPEGGRVSSIAMAPNNPATLYAGTYYYGGVLKSTDGGASWVAKNSGLPQYRGVMSLAVAPSNGNIIYAGVNGAGGGQGVFRSVNGGDSWSAGGGGYGLENVSCIAIHPNDPNIVYVGTYNSGILKTTNGGGTWSLINTGINYYDPDYSGVESLAIDPDFPETVYAATYGGLYKSTNGGGGWNAINSGIVNTYASFGQIYLVKKSSGKVLFVPSSDGLYESDTEGYSWYKKADIVLGSVTADPSTIMTSTLTLYAATTGNFYVSTDSGASWTAAPAGSGLPVNGYLHTVLVNPLTPATLYLASSFQPGGVFKSTNSGQNWSPANRGILNTYAYSLAIDPQNENNIYAGMYGGGGVGKSTDGGRTWSIIGSGLPNYYLEMFNSIIVSPGEPNNIYAVSYSTAYKSTDSGVSWSLLNLAGASAIAIQPGTPETVYAGSSSGMFKSTNGGQNWTSISAGLPFAETGGQISAVATDPANSSVVYIAAMGYDWDWNAVNPGVYKSENGGAWTRIGSTDIFTNAIAARGNTVYAVTYGGVLKSVNGGSWVNIGPGYYMCKTLAIDPTNPNKMYVGTESGVYVTSNGGSSWSAFNAGFTSPFVNTLAINSTGTNLYAGTYGGGIWDYTTTPVVAASPLSVDFGTVNGGTTSSGVLTISNSGPVSLNIASIQPTAGSPFTVGLNTGASNACQSLTPTIPANGNCSIIVSFTPTINGQASGEVTIQSNDVFKPAITVPLTGLGRMYTVVINRTGTGSGRVDYLPIGTCSDSACTMTVNPGTSMVLTPVAADGSRFGAWEGCGSDYGVVNPDQSCRITASHDLAVTANFIKTYTLTAVVANQGGHFVLPVSVTVDQGSSYTFTIITDEGYKIASLDDGGDKTALVVPSTVNTNISTYTLTNIMANHAIAVTFMQKSDFVGGPANAMAIDTTTFATLGMGTVYVGTPNGLFKSGNGGMNWESVTTAGLQSVKIKAVAIDTSTNPATIYVATQDGTFYKPANGVQWSLLINDGNIRSLAVDTSTTPPTVYAGTNDSGSNKIIAIRR